MTGAILILVSPGLRGLDLNRAVPEAVSRCLVVTGGPVPAGAERAAGVVRVQGYEAAAVVAAAERLTAGHRVARVVSFAEADVLPAAWLRDRWDLPGQRGDSAAAYRDKLLMRQYTYRAGLPGPASAAVETAADVERFVAAHGLPAVCKPRSASGSVGFRVLRTDADVAALPVSLPNHLVEGYVDGEVVHVDAVLAHSRPVFALPARYTELGCLAHLSDAGSGSALLAPSHAWREPVIQELWNVVGALPAAPDLVLHAEFFVPRTGRPVLCEIASRLPGHPIPPMIDRALGTSLRDAWLRLAAGLPVDLDALAAAADEPPAVANFGLPPRHGTLAAVPAIVPQVCAGWVHDLAVLSAPGEEWDARRYAARKSGDFVLTWTITAPDADLLATRIDDSARLLGAEVRWTPPAGVR